LIQIRGHSCENCKIEIWMGEKVPLVLDHENGNPADNSLNNLRLLCQNCNALTPTFGGKNKGFGRKSRGLPTK
jgi:5-methylcytosine-specific restriction endonuclease McrA